MALVGGCAHALCTPLCSSPKRKNRSSKGQDLVKTLNLLDTLNETQKKRIRKAFDTYDVDGSGFITAKDLRPVRAVCACVLLLLLL